MSADWQLPLITALKERDSVEKGDDGIFRAFGTILEKLEKSESLLDKLGGGDVEKKLQDALIDKEQLLDKLHNEETKSNALKQEVAKLQNTNSNAQKRIANLKGVITNLTDKLNNYSEEYQHKNKSIELLNDEFLSLSIQNNLLYDKLAKLEKDNAELIERWMLKVQQDADKMNQYL